MFARITRIGGNCMIIETKSVKCGDCNILCGKSGKLLIDCGSDNRGNGLSSQAFAFSKIEDEIDKKEITDILISHFDKDHFNGILEISDTYKLDNVYLPYSFIDGKATYTTAIGRLVAIAASDSWGFRLSQKIIDLFSKLEKISANIHFVKRDDSITFDGDVINVLWPEVVKSAFRYDDLPVKLTYETLADPAYIFYPFEMDEAAVSLSYIEERLSETFNQIVDSGNNELAETMQVFVRNFDDYLYRRQNGDSADFSFVERAFEQLNNQRRQFRGRLDAERLDIIKRFSRQQYHSLITSMNAISVVCDHKDQFIFLGDVPIRVIDYIASSFNSAYDYVKVQHHGTKAYFAKKAPVGKFNIISNGGFKKRKVNEQHIGANKIICTNAHNNPKDFCDYYIINKNQCASNCIKLT